MRKPITTLTVMAVMASSITIAKAHPGAKLLTTDSTSGQRAMSDGVSFEEVNGVHLFKGRPLQQDTVLLGAEPAPASKDCVIEVEIRQRSFRRLRTQGFYSGAAYPSRRYTQGFYSSK